MTTSWRSSLACQFKQSIDHFRSLPKNNVAATSRLQIISIYLILILNISLSLSNYNSFQLGNYMDDASYTVLAKSIISAERYGMMNVPAEPQPTRYPFGFPLYLSMFVWLFPTAPEVLKVTSLLATLLNILLIFWGWPSLSSNGSRWWGIIVAVLYATSPLVVGQTKMVMSEPFFTTLTLIGLILTERYLIRDMVNPAISLLTGIILILVLFTRNIGIVLIMVVTFRILILPIEKSYKQKKLLYLLTGGLILLTVVVALTPVTLKSLLPAEYMNQFTNPTSWGQSRIDTPIIPRIIDAFKEYVAVHLRGAILPIGGGASELEFGRRFGIPNLPLLTGLGIGVIVLLGNFYAIYKRALSPTVLMYVGLYVITILFWPWRDARFLYPVIPFLTYCFLFGLKFAFEPLNRIEPFKAPKLATIALAVIFVAISTYSIFKVLTDHRTSLDHVRDLRVGAVWLKDNSQPDDLIMAQQPQAIYLYAERQTIDFPEWYVFQSDQDFLNILGDKGVDYILIAPALVWRDDGLLEYDDFTSKLVLPVLHQLTKRNAVEIVYNSISDMVIVYKVNLSTKPE